MKTLTVEEIQRLDRLAIEKIGIPSLALMENAGQALAAEIHKKLKRGGNPRVVIVCGRGNNAGDGFVAARYLLNQGIKPRVFLVGVANHLKTDALINYHAAVNLGVDVQCITSINPSLKKIFQSAHIIVDAIFGVGLDRTIEVPFYGIIEAINTHSSYVLSVDVPSGLNGTTGDIFGICVRADCTLTFSAAKKGFSRKQGPMHTGRVIVKDIGIPPVLFKRL